MASDDNMLPLTAEDWPDRIKYEFDTNSTYFCGYLDAVERSVPVLAKIAEDATTFQELKAELLKFQKQQNDFVQDVFKRWWDNDNCKEEYGLPPM